MAGQDGFGVAFERSDMGAPGTFTAIASVTNVGGPETSRETYETTAHDSPDGWREFIGGLKDGGEVSLELNYDPREHDTLVEDYDDEDPRDYRVVWPRGLGTWAFKAIMTGFNPSGPSDDKLSAEATFKVSGKPTITPGV